MSTLASRSLRIVLALVALIAVLGSCAVTAGATFESVVEAEEEAAEEESDQDGGDETPGDRPPLRVETEPSDAAVYLDGRRQGATPLDLTDVEPGTYLLRIEKDGYYTVRRWIEIRAGSTLALEIRLERITGFLDVEVTPRDADVFVDGDRVSAGFRELPVGSYEVRARLFGYRSQTRTVRIRERRVTSVAFDLERAPFEIEELSAWRRRFNPSNPGLVGTTLISYRVTAAGAGTLTITDENDTVVRREPQGPYETWEQEYRWDGTDRAGRRVPDGSYTVAVSATGDDGRLESARTTVVLDSSIVVRYRSIWGASSGLLFVPTRSSLPAGQIQVATQVAGIFSPVGSAIVFRFPGRIGTRIGLGSGFELFGYGGFVAQSDPLDDRFSAGGALGWDGASVRLGDLSIGAGIVAGGTAQTGAPDGRLASPDTQASYPGVFAAVPISLGSGGVRLVVAPEYRLTAAPVYYGEGSLPENSWGSIGYLRSGIVADIGPVSLGVSGAVRTERVSQGLAIDLPFQAGAEVHWIVPGSSVALSGFAAAEVESITDFYIMSGLGIGVLF